MWVSREMKKRSRDNQAPVFGILERNGKVYTEIVIYSDGWRGYSGLVDVGYDKYYRVHHGKNEFSKGNRIHINGIENF